jgi:hypothetical protein
MGAQASDPRIDPGSGGLETRLAELALAVQRLESRVAMLEGRKPDRESPREAVNPAGGEPHADLLPDVPAFSPTTFLGLLGKACLVLAGAFLIRTFTESGALPKPAGVGLGFAYAAAWAFIADRSGRQGRDTAAILYTLTVALIAYPLLWEATLRLSVLTPGWAAASLLMVTTGLVAVAWRSSLEGAAWTVTLAALVSGLGLMMATSRIEAFCAVMILFGAGSLWLTYGQRWHGLRWPVAVAADGAVLVLTVLAAWPGGRPAAYRELSPSWALFLALSLVLVYLGSFVVRILQRRREVSLFEVIQTFLVLGIGFGGAVRVSMATGSGGGLLGASALIAGLACYAAAFAFVEKQSEAGKNFLFFTSLALLLVFAGTPLLLEGASLATGWTLLGLLAAMLGVRFERFSLLAHGAAYLTAAALGSGLLRDSLDAFLGPQGPPRPLFGFMGALLLLGLGTGHVLLTSQQNSGPVKWLYRLPAFLLGVQALLVLGALAIAILLPGTGNAAPDAGILAALRTGVLSVSAVLLAGVARKFPSSELGWLVYPILAATALKLLMEDVAKGRPLTLTLAFTLFGAALLLAPRLMRSREADSKEGPSAGN